LVRQTRTSSEPLLTLRVVHFIPSRVKQVLNENLDFIGATNESPTFIFLITGV
jgi:hypothetical protein